jgi:hypothetical protein
MHLAQRRHGGTRVYIERRLLHRTDRIESLLTGLGGHVWIETVDSVKNCSEGILKYQGKFIRTLVWIAVWVMAACIICKFYEFDCTFAGGKPYVLFVPMAVCNNIGIPLGYVLAPSERADTCLLFARYMKEKHDISAKDKHFLSDGGTGLAKYAQKEGHTQQLCYRHLLQDMGRSSYVAMLAPRLRFTSSEAHYRSLHDQTLLDFHDGWSDRVINKNGAEIFCRLLGILRDGTGFREVDRMAFAAQALWGEVRMEAGLLGASNHIEGFHTHVSEDAKHAPSTEVRAGMISD